MSRKPDLRSRHRRNWRRPWRRVCLCGLHWPCIDRRADTYTPMAVPLAQPAGLR